MITFGRGNLLQADAEALVNAVNTVGVMGKGIALMFKQRYPANTVAYERACAAGRLQTGRMFVTETGELMGVRWIINFPTKKHWRDRSRLEWIAEGLHDLRRVIVENAIRSIAIPALGAGNGGLDWDAVKPIIIATLSDLDDVDIRIYEPVSDSLTLGRSNRLPEKSQPTWQGGGK